MNFDNLLNECLSMWPNSLDVSDGRLTEDKGFYSQRLVDAWHQAETNAECKGEWHELMTWTLYISLHRIAKTRFEHQTYVFATESVMQEISRIKEDLAEHLHHVDYTEMFREFLNTEQ